MPSVDPQSASVAPSAFTPLTAAPPAAALAALAQPEAARSLPALVEHLAEYTTDAILVCEAAPADEAGPRILYANSAFTSLTDYEPGEAIGQPLRMLQGPLTSAVARSRIHDALHSGLPVVTELLNYRKDSSPFWVELNIVPVADPQGGLLWWVVVLRDVSDRRARESQHELNERILASLGEGIVVADALRPDMPIVFVNEMACTLTGYSREEFLGRNCRFLQGPETDRSAVARLRETLGARGSITLELLNYRKDGSTFHNLISLTPMADAAGQVVRYIGVQRDVTALRERERQLTMAQRLTAVGELAGGIAHDFNNLLSSIIGASQLLEDRLQQQPEQAELVRAITDSARRGAAQVRRLMTLTRVPSLQHGAVDLHHVVRQLLQLTRRNLRENISLAVELDPQAAWIDAEAVQTESALLNLILNAQDAMPQGGVIRLSSRRDQAEAGERIVVAVEDTGTGMDSALVQRLFNPFFTTKAPGRGSGLGLAMTHSFMRQLGGHVSVSSRPGSGSRFELWFPPAQPPAQSPAAPPAGEVGEPTEPSGQRSLSVLMVEDDPVLRLTGSAMLQHLGHRVTACDGGLSALDVLASPLPLDLLFTDLLMPGGVDGWDLANRCSVMRPDLPVVVTSGWADTALTPPQGRLRESVFLQKPYSLQDLSRGIGDALLQAERLRHP